MRAGNRNDPYRARCTSITSTSSAAGNSPRAGWRRTTITAPDAIGLPSLRRPQNPASGEGLAAASGQALSRQGDFGPLQVLLGEGRADPAEHLMPGPVAALVVPDEPPEPILDHLRVPLLGKLPDQF